MRLKQTVGYVVFVGVISVGASAWAEPKDEAAKLFADGKALLVKADFAEALRAFTAAAKADPKNEEYKEESAVLRRIIKIREQLGKEKNGEKWEAAAKSLRAFYYDNDIYSEALTLDRQVHDRLKTAESAAMLAETQLELGKNADAASLLSGLDEDKLTSQARVLLGIAWAREKELDKAQKAAAKLPKADEAGPGMLFDMARLASLTGDQSRAAQLLAQCFEATPPSRLASFKAYAKECKDLGDLVKTGAFAKAMETESKVKESGCSGGTSCGKCPLRGGCASGKEAKPGECGKGADGKEKKGEGEGKK
jgi:hypothetical protein